MTQLCSRHRWPLDLQLTGSLGLVLPDLGCAQKSVSAFNLLLFQAWGQTEDPNMNTLSLAWRPRMHRTPTKKPIPPFHGLNRLKLQPSHTCKHCLHPRTRGGRQSIPSAEVTVSSTGMSYLIMYNNANPLCLLQNCNRNFRSYKNKLHIFKKGKNFELLRETKSFYLLMAKTKPRGPKVHLNIPFK